VSAKKGLLTVKEGDKPPAIFDPATRNEFYSSDFRTLVFQIDADQRFSGFNVFTQAARGIMFNRVN
jgi:hypothetical protein